VELNPELDEELDEELELLGLVEPELDELDELEEEADVIFSDGTKQPVSDADKMARAKGFIINWLTDISPPSGCYYRRRIQPSTLLKYFCIKPRLTSESGLKVIFGYSSTTYAFCSWSHSNLSRNHKKRPSLSAE
jgi:hypothetical protein